MQQTSGFVGGRDVKEILENGKVLAAMFDQLSDQEIRAHVKKEYHVEYRHAVDWVNVFKRFGDRPKLIEGLSESAIRKLSSPSVDVVIAEQILADIRAEKIGSSCRAIDDAIYTRNKHKSPDKPQKEPIMLPIQPILPYVEGVMARKRVLEADKATFLQDIKDCESRLVSLCKEEKDYELRKKMAQIEVDRRDAEIASIMPLLKYQGQIK